MATADEWRDDPGQTVQERGSRLIFDALADRAPNPRAKRLITELYGKNSRGNPNAQAAARALGVHPSTVYNWLKKGLPSSIHAQDLRDRWQESPSGRRARISPGQISKLTSGFTASGTMTAHVWISNDRRNGLARSFSWQMKSTDLERVIAASRAGNDEEAHRILEESLEGFGGSAHLDITDLGVTGAHRPTPARSHGPRQPRK